MKRMGANFKEFDSNSTVMIVVEGQQALGQDAHAYYDEIIRKLGRITRTSSTSRTSGGIR